MINTAVSLACTERIVREQKMVVCAIYNVQPELEIKFLPTFFIEFVYKEGPMFFHIHTCKLLYSVLIPSILDTHGT